MEIPSRLWPGVGSRIRPFFADAQGELALIEGDLRSHQLDLLEHRVLAAGAFQREGPFFQHELAAQVVRNDRGAGEKAVAPTVVGVVMGIDDVAYRHSKLFFDEGAHRQGFFGKRQGIDNDGPLRSGDHPCCDLCIDFALEPVDVF